MIIQLYDTSHNRRMIKPKKSSGKKRKKREIIADLKKSTYQKCSALFDEINDALTRSNNMM